MFRYSLCVLCSRVERFLAWLFKMDDGQVKAIFQNELNSVLKSCIKINIQLSRIGVNVFDIFVVQNTQKIGLPMFSRFCFHIDY